MKKIKIEVIISLILAGTLSNTIMAQTVSTTNLDTNAILNKSCIVSVQDVAFGNIIMTNSITPLRKSFQVITLCSKGINFKLSANKGSSDSYASRTMTGTVPGNTDKLNYNLYTGAVSNVIIGDGSDGTSDIPLTSDGNQLVKTYWFRLLTNQFVTPDNYKDTLTINLNY